MPLTAHMLLYQSAWNILVLQVAILMVTCVTNAQTANTGTSGHKSKVLHDHNYVFGYCLSVGLEKSDIFQKTLIILDGCLQP